MTTYKEIHGTKVEVRDDDPANPVNGQVWYNSQPLKGFKSNPTGAWASGGNLNQVRQGIGGAGTQTAGLAFGGETPGSSDFNLSEEYNGTAWTEIADLSTGRNDSGAAEQRARLYQPVRTGRLERRCCAPAFTSSPRAPAPRASAGTPASSPKRIRAWRVGRPRRACTGPCFFQVFVFFIWGCCGFDILCFGVSFDLLLSFLAFRCLYRAMQAVDRLPTVI